MFDWLSPAALKAFRAEGENNNPNRHNAYAEYREKAIRSQIDIDMPGLYPTFVLVTSVVYGYERST